MPTNQEWLHKLANESPDELKAWFDAEHNDNLAAEKVVSCDAAHSNDGNAHLKASEDLSDGFTDSREKLEADMANILHSAYMYAWMHGHENRRGGSFSHIHREFFNLLDRQAAITEREHPGLTISDDESLINWHGENYLLQSRVLNAERERDEFSLKLNHEMELNRDNRNALDLERIAELQAQVDELTDSYEASSRALEILTLDKGNLTVQVDKLTRERDNLADDLLTCNREREQLRKHLGIALDHAHDICSLVDIDGNVLDVGE